MTTTIEPSDAAALAAELTGPLRFPDTPGYNEEIAGFNVAVRYQPALVVGAAHI